MVDINDATFCVTVALCFGVFLGGAIMTWATRYDWRAEAIKRGFAEYDSKTAEWRWKSTEDRPDV